MGHLVVLVEGTDSAWDSILLRHLSALLDKFRADFRDLSKIQAFVHTSLRRIGRFSWNRLFFTVSLHQK